MGKLTHDQALEAVYADRLAHHGDYVEVPTSLFFEKVDVNMAPLPPVAFFELGSGGKADCVRQADQPYSPLALSARDTVWVHTRDLQTIRRYAENAILSAAAAPAGSADSSGDSHSSTGAGEPPQPSLPAEKRVEILRRSAMLVVQDLFEDPSPENIKKSTKVVSSFVYVLMRDPKAYLLLTRLSSHDPYTLQHSVGVSVNSIILARKVGISVEKELQEIGLGGLLHDVGKVKVKKEIINKNGPLDELEWEEMRQHSLAGFEIVKDNPEIPEVSKRAILEHHEDKNGTGYPHGLRGDQTAIASRIVCLADIFNALTTNRSYSKARTPFDAFQFIREKLHHKIDDELFKNLVLVYGGKLPE
jgi:putative nucleotidyltransferase with HDIG domain